MSPLRAPGVSVATCVAVMAAVLVGWPLGLAVPVQDIDEAVYAEVARMMLHKGDWVHTEANYAGWFGHPVLSMWVVALAYSVGGIEAWVGRIPALLEVLVLAWMTFQLGRRTVDARTGWLAAALWMASPAASLMGHNVKTDLNLIAAMSGCILCGHHALERPRWWIPTGVLAALGMLAKGPIGLLLPGAVVLGAMVVEGRPWRQLARGAGYMVLGLLACAAVWSPWIVAMYRLHGQYFLDVNILWSTFKRFASENLTDDTTPLYFIHTLAWAAAPALPGVLAACWLAVGDARRNRAWRPRAWALVACWLIIPWAVMSTSRNKLPHYIFPVLPALCVLGAHGVLRALNGDLPRVLDRLMRAGTALLCALGVGVAGVLVAVMFPSEEGPGLLPVYFLGAAVVVGGCVAAWRSHPSALAWAPAVAATWVMALHSGAARPVLSRYMPGPTLARVVDEDGAPHHQATTALMLGDQQRFSTAFVARVKTEEIWELSRVETWLPPGEWRYAVIPQSRVAEVQRAGYRVEPRAFVMTFPTSRFSLPFARVENREDLAQPTLVARLHRPASTENR